MVTEQCARAAAAVTDELQLPPFPSELEFFDFGIETPVAADQVRDGMQFPSPPADFFHFDNPFPVVLPDKSSDDVANTITTTTNPDVVNFDSAVRAAVNLSERPEAERHYGGLNLVEKKGKVVRFWTHDEHRLFLLGEEKYGKGNWKDISRKIVLTKTSTQVASHAQKYYKYHQSPNSKQQNGKSCSSRSSIFDITTVDPDSRARLLRRHAPTAIVQPPSPPLQPLQQFTITNYYPCG